MATSLAPLNPAVDYDLRRLIRDYGDISSKDDMKNELQNLIDDYKKKDVPLFSTEPEQFPIDALKGCVSRTKCTGSGDKKECVTWEVCISN